jgi:hypothetical protein
MLLQNRILGRITGAYISSVNGFSTNQYKKIKNCSWQYPLNLYKLKLTGGSGLPEV